MVLRYSVAADTSSPVTVPPMVAGTPPRRTWRPACCWLSLRVTDLASLSVAAAGYQSCTNPAPRKLSLYSPAARLVKAKAPLASVLVLPIGVVVSEAEKALTATPGTAAPEVSSRTEPAIPEVPLDASDVARGRDLERKVAVGRGLAHEPRQRDRDDDREHRRGGEESEEGDRPPGDQRPLDEGRVGQRRAFVARRSVVSPPLRPVCRVTRLRVAASPPGARRVLHPVEVEAQHPDGRRAHERPTGPRPQVDDRVLAGGARWPVARR